jgi:hypothetical protein
MNKNIEKIGSEISEPSVVGKAFIVLSIRDMEQMLKAARKDARLSTAHPGKAPKSHARVIYADLLGPEHNGSEGEVHISSTSFMRSATTDR